MSTRRQRELAYGALVAGAALTAWKAGVGAAAVVGAATTLVGWIVSHRLSLKAQKEQFLAQTLYAAAQQLDRAIRTHSEWLSRAHADLFGMNWIRQLDKQQSSEAWFAAAESIRLNIFRGNIDWIFAFEAYEILFPETTDVRVELARLEIDLVGRAREMAIAFLQPDLRLAAFERSNALAEQFSTQQALFEDLRRHIQNKALGKLTGYHIPDRVPLDPKQPIITMGTDGRLHVCEAGLPLRPEIENLRVYQRAN